MFDMSRFAPRVTVAAIVEEHGRYLVVEERTPEGLRLNNPAGHLELGETPEAAVVREALEETARRFEPQAIVGLYLTRLQRPRPQPEPPEDLTYLRVAYCGTVGAPLPGLALDADIVRTLWLSAQELREQLALHRSPLLMRCVDDHRAGLRHPLSLIASDGSLAQPRLMR